jgi:hypothetical protein
VPGGGVYLVVLGHVSLVLGEGDGNVDLPPRRVAVLDQTAHLIAGRLELVLHLLEQQSVDDERREEESNDDP